MELIEISQLFLKDDKNVEKCYRKKVLILFEFRPKEMKIDRISIEQLF